MDNNCSPFNDKTRIERYTEANKTFPNARFNELNAIESLLPTDVISSVLEIGSGTGFLTKSLLAKGLTVDTIDPHGSWITGVRKHYQTDIKNGFPFIPNGEKYDLIVSLASFHHIIETSDHFQTQLIDDICRITDSNSYLLIVDVPNEKDNITSNCVLTDNAASYTSEFFNEIVDCYSTPFHNGVYLRTDPLVDQFKEYGWDSLLRKNIYCPWSFCSIEDLHSFISLLFNIPKIHEIPAYKKIINKMVVSYHDIIEFQWGLSSILLRRS